MEIGPRTAALDLFVRRLEARSEISAEERAALLALPGLPQRIDAHRDFVRMGESMNHACLVSHGIVARFAQLDDGSRQIIGFHVPGDMVDLYSLMLPRAPTPLQAMTDSTILKIPHQALRDLVFHHRGISAALWRDCVADGHAVAQWLVNVGRKDARARMAHLLCEMAVRLQQIGRVQRGTYAFPVTQEQLADALGLTAVHINRSLRALREAGLVSVARKQVTILDWQGLTHAGEFDPTYLQLPTIQPQDARVSLA